MIDWRASAFAVGCALFGALIAFELYRGDDERVLIGARLAAADKTPSLPAIAPARWEDLLGVSLARPLFSPTRRPSEPGDAPADADLKEKRLAGIVVEPNRRFAIFAAIGAKPLILGEGDTVNGWRIVSIAPNEVLLNRLGEDQTLQPKFDPNPIGQPPTPPSDNRLAQEPVQPPDETSAESAPSVAPGSPTPVAARTAAAPIVIPAAILPTRGSQAAAVPATNDGSRSAPAATSLAWPTFEGEQPAAASAASAMDQPMADGAQAPANSVSNPLGWASFEGGQ